MDDKELTVETRTAGESVTDDDPKETGANGKNKGDHTLAFVCGGICMLTIAFIVLKLCGVIAWSWIWIFSPLWGSVVLVFFLVLVMFIKGSMMR